MISWGHMEGVRAEKGPPGVGVKSELFVKLGVTLMLIPSPDTEEMMFSSSSSESVSTKTRRTLLKFNNGDLSYDNNVSFVHNN